MGDGGSIWWAPALIQYLSLIPIIHVNHRMIICLLNRFIPLIQLRYVISVKIYITNLWNSLSRSIKVPKGFRAPGLRGSGLKIAGLRGSGAPGLRTTINRAPGLPRNWSRAPGSILFCFNPKANPIIKKVQQFLHSTRISQLLELFINPDQWMRLIFDTVNDVSGFQG